MVLCNSSSYGWQQTAAGSRYSCGSRCRIQTDTNSIVSLQEIAEATSRGTHTCIGIRVNCIITGLMGILSLSLSLVLGYGVGCAYTRSLLVLSHLYMGGGLHPVLRGVLTGIETVSYLFRSISLTLRMVCNTVAGHVLLCILLSMGSSGNTK